VTCPSADRLASYQGRKGRVDIVDVPELGYLTVSGRGSPRSPAFTDAARALAVVSAAARLVLKNEYGAAPRAMPLEAQWWVDAPFHMEIVTAVALGHADVSSLGDERTRWQAMMMQPQPVDGYVVEKAIKHAGRRSLAALDQVRYVRLAEGRCAQVLHVGRRADEPTTVTKLHQAIAAAGYEATGRRHDIYLSDQRRTSPENLRMLLRQPISPWLGARW
jgi:hypothetical protein